MNVSLAILGSAVLLQIVTFLLLRRSAFCPKNSFTEAQQKKTFTKIHDMRNKLTWIQWTSNELLSGEHGATNIAQKEFLYGIAQHCTEAQQELESVLTDLQWKVSGKVLGEPEEKRQ